MRSGVDGEFCHPRCDEHDSLGCTQGELEMLISDVARLCSVCGIQESITRVVTPACHGEITLSGSRCRLLLNVDEHGSIDNRVSPSGEGQSGRAMHSEKAKAGGFGISVALMRMPGRQAVTEAEFEGCRLLVCANY